MPASALAADGAWAALVVAGGAGANETEIPPSPMNCIEKSTSGVGGSGGLGLKENDLDTAHR